MKFKIKLMTPMALIASTLSLNNGFAGNGDLPITNSRCRLQDYVTPEQVKGRYFAKFRKKICISVLFIKFSIFINNKFNF
jgi:hypothetical protein